MALGVGAVKVYRATLKRYFVAKGTTCLHYPTCSEYARLAFEKHAFPTAALMAWRRYRDCNPLSGRPYLDFP